MTTLPGLDRLFADPLLADFRHGRRDAVLALDYDGTLAPFTADRDKAGPYPGVVDILRRLPSHGPGRFVVVSGREAETVAALIAPARPGTIWGCHGAQRLSPGQPARLERLEPAWAEGLERALALAARFAPPQALESKPVSLALHWRGLEPGQVRALARRTRAVWAPLARESGLVLHPFDGGIELRAPAWDKGRVVHALRRENPGALLVYLGDDRTDEDAFTALGPAGIGILVRQRPRATAAGYRITPPGDLRRFLTAWASVTTAARGEILEVS